MRLSILIPSVPSRFEKAEKLYNHLLDLVGDKSIEVLLFMDNKKRSIGAKRDALKNISKGKYFMFCDDDDWIDSIEEIYEAAKKNVDVITFKARCKNNSGSDFIVTFGLGNDVEHLSDGNGNYLDLKRPPFHSCAWDSKFRKIKFPDINYGEDWIWVEQALKKATKETHIDKVIHRYNYDPKISEASLESNNHWKNPNTKRAIVNFCTEGYLSGQERLKQSLVNSGIDVYCFTAEDIPGCPAHTENPYAFKIYSIEKVKQMGYDQVLWLDASVVSVKDPHPVFDWLTEKGIFLEEAGHLAGTWAPDYVLQYFDLTKDAAMKMPMFAAGYCGFDFRKQLSIDFFAEWKESMLNGMFKGTWDVSRHDMTAGSIIANKRGLLPLYSPGGNFFAYIGEGYGRPLKTAVFNLLGI